MNLTSLRIQNFRSFSDEEILFDDYTCFVGPNGSGKSSILSALNVLFRNAEAPTDVCSLHEEDFHYKNTNDPIKITVTFEDLSSEDKKDLKDYIRQDKLVISAIAKWDPEINFAEVFQVGSRQVIRKFSKFFAVFDKGGKVSELKDIYKEIKSELPELKEILTKDGMREALREYEEEHPELCELVESSDQFYGWSRGINKLEKYFQWVFIPAIKDPSEEQDESKNTALGKLLQRTIRAKVDFEESLREIRSEVEEKYKNILANEQFVLSDISSSLERRLQQWSHPGARVELKWHYDEKKSISIADPAAHVKIGEGDFLGELVRLGHGIQRSFLVAILQELVRSDVEHQPTLILAIEEPELYQHPPQARHLASVLEALSKQNSQMIITTHSPYFISGRGFESVRMTRKYHRPEKSKITQYTHSELSKKLAEALGETPRTATSTMAAVEQIMQPSQNELFFSRIPILVEGTEDVAFIATYLRLMQKWDDFRKYGCHFVICEGKSRMSRPLAIAQGLNIPFFIVFDGDGDKCTKPDVKIQHERDNGCLLRLCGYDSNPIPTKNIWGDNFIVWKTDILNEVINEFGIELWNEAESNSRKEHSLVHGVKQKHPLIVTATLEKLWNEDKKSAFLQKSCEQILRFSVKCESV